MFLCKSTSCRCCTSPPICVKEALWGGVSRLFLLFRFFVPSDFNLHSVGCENWTRRDASVVLQAERECFLSKCNNIPAPGIACGYLHQAQALKISKWKCSRSSQGQDTALCMHCEHMTACRNSTSAVSSRECFRVLQNTCLFSISALNYVAYKLSHFTRICVLPIFSPVSSAICVLCISLLWCTYHLLPPLDKKERVKARTFQPVTGGTDADVEQRKPVLPGEVSHSSLSSFRNKLWGLGGAATATVHTDEAGGSINSPVDSAPSPGLSLILLLLSFVFGHSKRTFWVRKQAHFFVGSKNHPMGFSSPWTCFFCSLPSMTAVLEFQQRWNLRAVPVQSHYTRCGGNIPSQ